MEINKLESLVILNLSHNYLSGFIPKAFEQMHGLLYVDISYNELQGSIPNNNTFQALQGNKGLCEERHLESKQIKTKGQVLFLSTLQFNGRTLYDEIIKVTNGFDALYYIGKGGQGIVYKVELTSGDIVAVKKFNQPLHDAGENRFQKEFLNEIRYLERGSLSLILGNEDTAKVLGWNQRLNIVKGVAYAMSYMHHDCSPPIIHHDISSSNILLDSQFEAHVSDFGSAKLLELDSSNWTSPAGTYGYIAPVIRGQHPGDFISSLSMPTAMENMQVKDVLDQRLPFPVAQVENELIIVVQLAMKCLNVYPQSRPTVHMISQVLSTNTAHS
ncbi:MDIS1-interacting receptor like kinase 2-like [Juglans regia]|uniref:non-specific serine/threonine protein kinase n=1 Tax=Juglans regia TaxID=51240 RepID=A0A6P9ELH2_JUGRE|nr:MDIS1-interacting receptor like kinase 2-like [Juglans regia]